MSNLYATLDQAKTRMGIASSFTTDDALILEYLEEASREVDSFCDRFFYVKTATKTLDGTGDGTLLLPDLLSLTSLAVDNDSDGVYDDETWAAADYALGPLNEFPKRWIMRHPGGDYYFGNGRGIIQIAGLWGYGDGTRATPYDAIAATATVASASTTTATMSASGHGVQAGHTILIETEQLYVSAVSGTSLTVRRGMNGTAAATHAAGSAVAIYRYPLPIRKQVLAMAMEDYTTGGEKTGFSFEQIGSYQYRKDTNSPRSYDIMMRTIGGFRRLTA